MNTVAQTMDKADSPVSKAIANKSGTAGLSLPAVHVLKAHPAGAAVGLLQLLSFIENNQDTLLETSHQQAGGPALKKDQLEEIIQRLRATANSDDPALLSAVMNEIGSLRPPLDSTNQPSPQGNVVQRMPIGELLTSPGAVIIAVIALLGSAWYMMSRRPAQQLPAVRQAPAIMPPQPHATVPIPLPAAPMDVKASLNPRAGTTTGSSVPDLPKNLEARIASAHTDQERQAALDALYIYLDNFHIIPNTKKFHYQKSGKDYGLTEIEDPKTQEMKITIYGHAFDAGSAVVYSTVRHELIHAQQNQLEPDIITDANDPVFYTAENQVGGFIGPVQHAMQEIETHVWEIEHSNETGVDLRHINNRYQALNTYYNDLITYANKLGTSQRRNWKAYVRKARDSAERVLRGHQGFKKGTITWLP